MKDILADYRMNVIHTILPENIYGFYTMVYDNPYIIINKKLNEEDCIYIFFSCMYYHKHKMPGGVITKEEWQHKSSLAVKFGYKETEKNKKAIKQVIETETKLDRNCYLYVL